ncbi:sensor histidine kinase [Brachybacterium hainanense]|uniref:histidine kinase n=1 Tax=Brachybacterium hainanense TaxID=1541174 RepID=A0ABV6R8C7_9MICO
MPVRELLPRTGDLVLAALLGLVNLGFLRPGRHGGPRGGWGGNGPGPSGPVPGSTEAPAEIGALGIGLVVAAVLAVALRRWPLPAFALAAAATSLYLGAGLPYGPILLSLLACAYSLGRQLVPSRAALAAGGGILLLGAAVLVRDGVEALLTVVPGSAWIVVPFSIGLVRRLVLEARQRRREEAQRQVLDAERLRLASEVHDVVGHGLAAIQMHADIALHVRGRRPDQAYEALEAISRASAEALTELRSTLAQVAPAEAAASESRAPTPGLARLDDLLQRMRDAGIAVDLQVMGTARALPGAADVAAYRIVQESLTNVVKHASERRAQVRIRYEEQAVGIEVRSRRREGETLVEGFGITGMRRRAQDAGGRLEVHAEDEELRVQAQLPG